MLSIRQKTIVRYILGHPGGVAGHQLSELLRVSGKTIRNDISDINRWMKEYEIRICASQKEGYYIPEAYRNHMMSVLENQADPDINGRYTRLRNGVLQLWAEFWGAPESGWIRLQIAFAFRSRRYTRIYTS